MPLFLITCTISILLNKIYTKGDKIEGYKTLSFASYFGFGENGKFVVMAVKNTSSKENFTLTDVDNGFYTLEIHEGTCNYLIIEFPRDKEILEKIKVETKAIWDTMNIKLNEAKKKSLVYRLTILVSFHKKIFGVLRKYRRKEEKHKCPKFTFKQRFKVEANTALKEKFDGVDIGDTVIFFDGMSSDENDFESSLTIRMAINKDGKAMAFGFDLEEDPDFSHIDFFTSKIMIDAFSDMIGMGNYLVIIIVVVCVVGVAIIAGIVVAVKRKSKPKGQMKVKLKGQVKVKK